MAKFRVWKKELAIMLLPPAWPLGALAIPEEAANVCGIEAVSPLLALLARGGLVKWRSAVLLGRVVPEIAKMQREEARNIMRRCMWHMNEDSGNMGWGVAEAMGEIAAKSPALAGEYGKVILSYVRDTGFADNYIDHAQLRCGAYWAVGRFAPEYAAFHKEGWELLAAGLRDQDRLCRGIAAWGVGRLALVGFLATNGERAPVVEQLRQIADEVDSKGDQGLCEVLEGLHLCTEQAATFARQALARVNAGEG